MLLIAWFIGSAVVNAPFPAVARQVRSSEVLRGVNDVHAAGRDDHVLRLPAPDRQEPLHPGVRRARHQRLGERAGAGPGGAGLAGGAKQTGTAW